MGTRSFKYAASIGRMLQNSGHGFWKVYWPVVAWSGRGRGVVVGRVGHLLTPVAFVYCFALGRLAAKRAKKLFRTSFPEALATSSDE